VTSSWSIFI